MPRFFVFEPRQKGRCGASTLFPFPVSQPSFSATIKKWSQWPGLPDLSRDCGANMPDFIGKSSQIVSTNLYSF
jgi:hypothetical protein